MLILKKAIAPIMLLILLLTVLPLVSLVDPPIAGATVETATVATATGTGTATFTASEGNIGNLTAWAQSQLACQTTPAAYFPHGFFAFNIIRIENGATVTITITLPSNMPTSTQYWKCINGQWVDATSILGSNDGDNILTLTLTDGSQFDADGVANGVIVDPGGPGMTGFTQQPQEHKVSRPLLNPPSIIVVKNMNISPQQAYTGQPITISANMANDGGGEGGYTASLKIDGKVEQTKVGTVDGHSAVPVNFTISRSQPGTYTIDIGGQKGTFTVLAAKTTSGPSVSSSAIVILVMFVLIISTVVVLMLTFRRPA